MHLASGAEEHGDLSFQLADEAEVRMLGETEHGCWREIKKTINLQDRGAVFVEVLEEKWIPLHQQGIRGSVNFVDGLLDQKQRRNRQIEGLRHQLAATERSSTR